MADFLGRTIEVLARIVIERLDQRGARRHRMLPRVVGETDQIMRAVG